MNPYELNVSTNRMIVFHYPNFAGGKFIINCMGLSSSMVLQHEGYAHAQIEGNLAMLEKYDILMSRLGDEDIKKRQWWNDLNLGCSKLWLIDKTKSVPSALMDKDYDNFNDDIKFLFSELNDSLWFPWVWHSRMLNEPSNFHFPNARVVTFENNINLTNYRTSLLEESLKNEIRDNTDITWNEGELPERVPDFIWNTEWFNNESTTMNGIESLYNLFNLDEWEQAEPLIREYYSVWLEKNCL